MSGLFRQASGSLSLGRSETKSWSVTRSWNTTRSIAEGHSWSDAASQQRVYEHAVEPQTLQNLPDYAMLMVHRSNGDRAIAPVECNPDLISMPRFSMDPLSAEPQPAHAGAPTPPPAAHHTANVPPAAPGWPSQPPPPYVHQHQTPQYGQPYPPQQYGQPPQQYQSQQGQPYTPQQPPWQGGYPPRQP